MTTVIIGQSCGLPNITGTFSADNVSRPQNPTGCIEIESSYNNPIQTSSDRHNSSLYKIDASKSNSIYGNSDRVTTDNITVRYWKRIA